MTFQGPIAPDLIGALAAGMGALAVLAYVLKMRRRRFEVPFSVLWQRVLGQSETTSLWKQLRRLLSLLLQLTILALLCLAALDPRFGAADDASRHVVFVIDASASMKATDEGPSGQLPRIAEARRVARELLAQLGSRDRAMILRMDGQATPLSRFDSDHQQLARLVGGITASDTPAALRTALARARDALRGRRQPSIVLIGDGAYPESELAAIRLGSAPAGPAPVDLSRIELGAIDLRFVPVGRRGDNVAITAFNVRRYFDNKLAYEALVEVQNFGARPVRRKLVIASGGTPIDVSELSLPPGRPVRKIYPGLGGGDDSQLRAWLGPVARDAGAAGGDTGETERDVLALDDEAHALLPARSRQKALLVTHDNLYLEGALLAYDNVQVDKLAPEAYDRAAAAGQITGYDVLIFDGHTPASLPAGGADLLYFAPRGPGSPFASAGALPAPRITEVNDRHPAMRWVGMSDVNFDSSAVFRVDRAAGEVPLLSSVNAVLGVARRSGARKIAAFGFALDATDLTLRVAFPLLLINLLDWFSGDDSELLTTYRTGQRVAVPLDATAGATGTAVVELPGGGRMPAALGDGEATFYLDRVGVHTLVVRHGDGPGDAAQRVLLAANLASPDESRVAPQRLLRIGGTALRPPALRAATGRHPLWTTLVVLALLALTIEWLTYHRRVTV